MSTQQSESPADPFGTAEIRRRVLAGWRDSPARFREDANTEEDFALGGYRDRLVVELAQNAADAAVRADVPGRLRFILTPDALLAANTGEPLSAEGVQALATLRASHKTGLRDGVTERAGARGAGPELFDPARIQDRPDAEPTGPEDVGPEDAGPEDAGSEHTGAGVVGRTKDERPQHDEAAVVGRFGVGFAAVLSVTDEPGVHSGAGSVRFSRQRTFDEVSPVPELAGELTRRAGHVPVLRLPYPEPPGLSTIVPDGFDTVVRLPFRDEAAYATARRALQSVDDTLLLALPALRLVEIDIEQEPRRVLSDVEDRWRVFRSGGFWNEEEHAALLADRPTEERDRASWSVTWALPRGAARSSESGGFDVLHAPTPTDETLSLPALLIGSFPLDPSRRRVQPGPLTERLVGEAARAYADMVAIRAREDAEDVREGSPSSGDFSSVPTVGAGLDLVPVGLPVSEFDVTLTEAIRALLPRVPLLPAVRSAEPRPADGDRVGEPGPRESGIGEPPAGGPPVGEPPAGEPPVGDQSAGERGPDGRPALLAGRDAVSVDGLDDRAAEVLAAVVPNLVMPARTARAVLDVLGVRRVALADLVEELAGVAESRPVAWWRRLYDACADLVSDPMAAEALGALPVPLADGRTVHGPRGVLLPHGGIPAAPLKLLVAYGMRVAHPDAASPTLEWLGARPADPATLLADPATRTAVGDAARRAAHGDRDTEEPPRPEDRLEPDETPLLGEPPGPAEGFARAETFEPSEASGADEAFERDEARKPSGATSGATSGEGLEPVATAVLRLVRAAGGTLRPGSPPWLGELPLSDADGELVPAGSLVLPGSAAERLMDPDEFAVVSGELVERWGAETLRNVGVLETLGVSWAMDVDLAALPEELLDLPDIEDWAEERLATSDDPVVPELVVVRDLDLVDPDAWSEALRLIGSEPELRRALLAEPSYTAWWIAGYLRCAGTADPDAEADVAGLLAPAPSEVADLDPGMRAKLGIRRELGDLDRTDIPAVLAALADPETALDAGTVVRVWRRLAGLADQLDPTELPEAPDLVRVLDGAGTRLASEAVVVDSPMWSQLEDAFRGTGLVAAPADIARVLAVVFDLPLIEEATAELLPDANLAGGLVVPDEPGSLTEVPAAVRLVLPEAPESWYEHDEVRVAGHPVDWWVDADGLPHAATTDGLARGLAWAAGAENGWPARYAVSAVLSDPEAVESVLPESAFDRAPR